MIDRQSVALFLGVACVVSLGGPTMGHATEQKPERAAPLAAVVSFDHLLLRQNESANVDVWLTNSSDQNDTVTLSIAGTNLIQWRDGTCPEKGEIHNPLIHNPLTLRALPAYSSVHLPLCALVNSQVYVGDYNVLFTFEYQTDSSPPERGLVAIEKTVRLSFLGTDSIAGIPLAFSCFILPGFFFWAAAELLGAFKGMGQALGEKTIYSVMISFAIVALSTWHTPMSVALGVSVSKLVLLCVSGTGAGLLCGIAVRVVQSLRSNRALQRKLKPDERYDLVLEKLLEKNPTWIRPKVTLRLNKDVKEEYIGSLYGTTDTDDYVLIGWFQVKVPVGNSKVESLEKERQLPKIVAWARKNGVNVEKLRPIRARIGAGAEQETEQKYVMSWKKGEVSGVSVEFEQTAEPLQILKGVDP